MNNDGNEPVVLGNLKKEKSSKPFFVIFCFILLIGTCFGLPYIKEYFSSENNSFTDVVNKFINDLLNKDENVIPQNPEEKKISEDLVLINLDAKIIFEKVTLSDIEMNSDGISFKISNSGDALVNDVLFLEIYSENEELLTRVHLVESTNMQKYYNFIYTDNTNYYGKIVRLNENEYEFVENLSVLNCELNNEKYTYNFINDKLVSLIYQKSIENVSVYSEIVNELINLGVEASINEEELYFTETLDFNIINKEKLGFYYDYKFYELGSSLKKINYEMKTLGFDCK